MVSTPSQLAALPVIQRCAIVGGIAGLVIGGVLGLVLGLRAHPATAWFAILEVGIPAALLGVILGALVGLVARIVHTNEQ